jgi:hypothetical protein
MSETIKPRLIPKPTNSGSRRLIIAKTLINPNYASTMQQPLPVGRSWWNKYFDCFTRRRSNSNIQGGKYKRVNKTIRRRRN